ncbi:hypothetical protein BH23ACT12_BH23ACT12_13890 [soil metagenome]
MRKPGRRAQMVAVVIGAFVLASLAVAAASGRLGGDDDLQMDSAEPSSTGQSTGEGTAADEPDPALGEAPAGRGGGSAPARSGVDATADPDSPVSSAGSLRPPPIAVPDPPSGFSGIRNFEQCAAAGYPVMESYPEQCRTPDGRLFVRVVE